MKGLNVILFLIIFLLSSFQKKGNIIRMNAPSNTNEVANIISYETNIKDTIPNKTLKIYTDKNKLPIKYSRDIITGVCIKGECRLVKIILFWNSTGRYLGYELPNGEFLSKTEHDPFKVEEYNRLHELLEDANSVLAAYEINELVPAKDSSTEKVDAITSATIAAVLDYIVEGAVYTTYTLWHIAYGPTKREIEKLTSEKLDANLALQILESERLDDKVWTLNHMSEDMEISPALQNKLIDFISGNDVYLAERSLHAIKPNLLNYNLQLQLSNIIGHTGFLQKRLILQKLKSVDKLNPKVVEKIATEIPNMNGTLIKSTLELFQIHSINQKLVLLQASDLLKNENRYIANQAFKYLETCKNLDKKTLKNIEKYKKKNL